MILVLRSETFLCARRRVWEFDADGELLCTKRGVRARHSRANPGRRARRLMHADEYQLGGWLMSSRRKQGPAVPGC